MKIVKFKGGMGNQMFQYAFLRNLQLCYEIKDVKADFSYFTQCEKDKIRVPRIMSMNTICDTVTEQELKKMLYCVPSGDVLGIKYRLMVGLQAKLNSRYYFESDRAYREVDKIVKYDYFDGYWQSWRYLEPIRDVLLKEFSPKGDLSGKSLRMMEKLTKCNSVFVGIRRGDYISDKQSLAHYGDCDFDYYKKAIKLIQEKVVNPVIIFFSNDIEWVKENMNEETLGCSGIELLYRNEEDIFNDFEELYVMASCKHAIITNSTFNFWGAWLIQNPDKIVVAPKAWFKDNKPIDIVPDEWIKL